MSNDTSHSRFVKPTIEDVKAYCEERNNGVNAQWFVDYYESKGWKVGTAPMKDWRAAVRNWERSDKSTAKSKCNYDTAKYPIGSVSKIVL